MSDDIFDARPEVKGEEKVKCEAGGMEVRRVDEGGRSEGIMWTGYRKDEG